MADIRPFRGIRYNLERVGGLGEVLGPSDDIPSTERARELVAGRPFHSVRLEMRDPNVLCSFEKAGCRFRSWLRSGVLIQDEAPALYVYEHTYRYQGVLRRQRGFFAALCLDSAAKCNVLPHEGTLPDNLDLRVALLRGIRANLSGVYTLTTSEGQVDRTLASIVDDEPAMSGTDDEGGMHRLWVVKDPEVIATLQGIVAERPLYIADGHHRYAAAQIYREERRRTGDNPEAADRVLAFIADAVNPGILILPIHRVVRALDRPWTEVLEHLQRHFSVEVQAVPEDDPEGAIATAVAELAAAEETSFLLLEPGGERLLTMRLRDPAAVEPLLPSDASPLTRQVDVTLLDSVVLRHVFGIPGEAVEERITFTPEVGQAVELVRNGGAATAIFVRPTLLESLLAVARAGDRMPQKSTYFYPKIPIGIVMHDLGATAPRSARE